MQQGDVLLFQTDDDGEINIENGVIEMSGGLETAAYLSMYGGNEEDDGRADNAKSWWGNVDENNLANQYRSETQHLLQSLPATTGNLRRLEDAAGRDLNWFIEENVASTITVFASIPGINRVKTRININAEGEESTFEFTDNWKVAA